MKTLGRIAIAVQVVGLALVAVGVAAGEAADVRVKNGWVSLPLLDDQPAEAYFLMQNFGKPRKLVGADSVHAKRIEIHRVAPDGGTEKIDEWEIPSKGSVLFSPGGLVLVLFEPKDLELGKTIPIELVFADGDKLSLEAVVKDE
jgi:copper(I)-binding protein